MNRILIFFVFVGVIWAWNSQLNYMSFGSRTPSSHVLKSDPCEGKKTCALIYVAPWCPACKSMASTFREFGKNSVKKHDIGFKVVIGQGRNQAENEGALPMYGLFARVDESGIAEKLGVPQYPSFYILDAEGAKIVEQTEAFQWMQENFR